MEIRRYQYRRWKTIRNLGRARMLAGSGRVVQRIASLIPLPLCVKRGTLKQVALSTVAMSSALASPAGPCLFVHATIITVNQDREVIIDGALLTRNGRIAAIGKTSEIVSQHQEVDTQTIDCKNKIIIPGLINTHAHLAQSLLRGLAENLNLHSWLCDAVWPLEANYAKEDGYVAAQLTIAEMLGTGTTCFLEAMLTHRSGLENVVRAVEQSGIRACLVSNREDQFRFNAADSNVDCRAN